uniref:Uncharacterized protein n=1 Tax=Rhizophora mucronata TaxID=61149 RepID=A0A2P2ITS2_RHIMU
MRILRPRPSTFAWRSLEDSLRAGTKERLFMGSDIETAL